MRRIHKALFAIAMAAMMFSQAAGTPVANITTEPQPAFADVDLGSELRVLNAFFVELARFDKKSNELSDKASLTRAEFDSQQRAADDLKRCLSSVQSALRDAIRKLKAAGLWENLNQIVAERSTPQSRRYIEQDNFKNSLDRAASDLSSSADDLVSIVDALRNKVKAQADEPLFGPGDTTLASRAVRVAHTTALAPASRPVRCALARVRLGIANLFSDPDDSAPIAILAVGCYCDGNAGNCALIGASPPR